MKLKTSLYSSGLVVSNMKRYWWISSIYFLFLFFSLPVYHLMQKLPMEGEWQIRELIGTLQYNSNDASVQFILLFTVPVIMGVLLFSYLNTSKAVTAVHILPFTRKTLYFSHLISGIILLSLPVFLITLILAGINIFTGLNMYYSITDILMWLGLTLLFNYIFYAVTVFVGMFTGNSIAHIAFTYIFNILPVGIYYLIGYNLEELLYGFSFNSYFARWLNAVPFIYISQFNISNFNILHMSGYILLFVLLIIISLYCYEKRDLETAGELITFRVIRPVFKYGLVFCAMLSAGLFLHEIYDSSIGFTVFIYFFAALISYFIAQVLLDKSFKVWNKFRGYLIYSAAIMFLLIGIKFDFFGYVNRIPAVENIDGIYFNSNYYIPEDPEYAKENRIGDGGYYEKKENIQSIIDLHKYILSNPVTDNYSTKCIVYYLKSGRRIIRSYKIDDILASPYLKPIYESMEYKERRYPVLNQNADDIKYIEFNDDRSFKDPFILSDKEKLTEFMDILTNNIKKAPFEEVYFHQNYPVQLKIVNQKDEMVYYELEDSYSDVFKWLKDNKYDEFILTADDIDYVRINFGEKFEDGGYTMNDTNTKEIKDPQLISEMFQIYQSNVSNFRVGNFIILNFSTGNRHFEGYIYDCTPMSDDLKKEIAEARKSMNVTLNN